MYAFFKKIIYHVHVFKIMSSSGMSRKRELEIMKEKVMNIKAHVDRHSY